MKGDSEQTEQGPFAKGLLDEEPFQLPPPESPPSPPPSRSTAPWLEPGPRAPGESRSSVHPGGLQILGWGPSARRPRARVSVAYEGPRGAAQEGLGGGAGAATGAGAGPGVHSAPTTV